MLLAAQTLSPAWLQPTSLVQVCPVEPDEPDEPDEPVAPVEPEPIEPLPLELLPLVYTLGRYAVFTVVRVLQGLPAEKGAELVLGLAEGVRVAIAQSTHTPDAILELLAQDEAFGVRQSVLYNGRVPKAALLRLASDPDIELRRQLAGRQSLPKVVAAQLYRDSSPQVREALLQNPHFTGAFRERLLKK
mgnify:CR=1 FL=1